MSGAEFEPVNERIARTQKVVVGPHATLGFLGAALVAVIRRSAGLVSPARP